MSYTRGNVIVATDPFKGDDSAARPFLVVDYPETPFHGEQYIVLSLTTRTWYDERIPLTDEDWIEGGSPESSSIMPWSVNAIKTQWIDYYQGTLHEDVVDEAVVRLVDYISD